MSTTPTSSQCTTSPNLLGEFSLLPRADIILRSCDFHDFRVQKLYVIDSSPVLGERIMAVGNPHPTNCLPKRDTITATSEATVDGEAKLPVVQLPESHTIISSLLTFLFPVPPVLPPTIEQILELLFVAQKYQATTALTRIRDCASRRDPKIICSETALQVYSLAWKYGLLEEALQAAEDTLKMSMTLPDFEDKADIMPGAALSELWKYHQRVVDSVTVSLGTEFEKSEIWPISAVLECEEKNNDIPAWLDSYLDCVVEDPAYFDITTFHLTLSSHISPPETASVFCKYCKSTSGETIRKLWSALTAVFHGSIKKVSRPHYLERNTLRISPRPQAGMDFSLTQWEIHSQRSTLATTRTSLLVKGLNTRLEGGDVILQSSDLISFRVHKSTMVISSPFFKDLFSLPQPHDGEVIDGLPVVHVSEDTEVLYSLLTLLYPIPSVMPGSYEKKLALLAASQKYNMDTVSSNVRREMVLPTTEAAFHAYAIASSKRLIPEMETAARLTLNHPMTFESIIDALPSFEGSALHDLIHFRKRCRDNLLSFFIDLVDGNDNLSTAWYNCRTRTKRPHSALQSDDGVLAGWFRDLVSEYIKSLREIYTCPLPKSSSLRKEFTEALSAHVSGTKCTSCSNLYATEGEALREKWLRRVSKARDKVRIFPPSLDCGFHIMCRNPSNSTLEHQTRHQTLPSP